MNNQPIRHGPWDLVYKHDGSPVCVGDKVASSKRDYVAKVTGGRPPHHAASTGRIYVSAFDEATHDEFFPQCFDLEWVKRA